MCRRDIARPVKTPIHCGKTHHVPLSENSLKVFDVSEGRGGSGSEVPGPYRRIPQRSRALCHVSREEDSLATGISSCLGFGWGFFDFFNNYRP